ncbi:MAG: carboxypeptidase-like regulatory domain-containing protein [Holophagales bacterium]|nr:carboxypeptidase-like regulatory domain-containing protein [Holophagales bacterium]
MVFDSRSFSAFRLATIRARSCPRILGRLAWIVSLVSAAPAAGMEVRLSVSGGGADPEPVPAVVRAFDAGAAEGEAVLRTVETTVPGRGVLEIEGTGVWRLEVAADGYWAAPTFVRPGLDSGASIDLHPTGALWVEAPRGESPEPLSLGFGESRFRGRGGVGLRGMVPCEVGDGAWSCRAPAGVLDLKLHVPGWVPEYLFDQRIVAGARLDLPGLPWQRGASLVGRVTLARGTGSEPEADLPPVRLRLRSGAVAKPREAVVDPAARGGFFQLAPLEAGEYVLEAEAEGFAPLLVEHVRLHAGSEASLLRGLTLARPIEAVIELDPPRDLAGKAWRIQVLDLGPVPSLRARGRTDTEGRFRTRELSRGDYRVMIDGSAEGRVAVREISLGEDTVFPISIETIWVEGKVLLAGEPVPASLAFGGRHGAISVPMDADGEGAFAGVLPRAGDWQVDVSVKDPPVNRRLMGVAVDPGPDGIAQVELDLPATTVEVRVRDSEGEPVRNANVVVVRVTPPLEPPSTDRTDTEGSARFHGLGVGDYMAEAMAMTSRGMLPTETGKASLSEETPDVLLELTLREAKILRGRLLSATGAPVIGAQVFASFPRPEAGNMMVPQGSTDEAGRFTLEVPEAVAEVELKALSPGYPLLLTRRPAEASREMVLRLQPPEAAGWLELRVDPATEERPLGGTFYVVYGSGSRLTAADLRQWRHANLGGSLTAGGWLEVPLMPGGRYSLCMSGTLPESGDCTQGWLAPGQVLELATADDGSALSDAPATGEATPETSEGESE